MRVSFIALLGCLCAINTSNPTTAAPTNSPTTDTDFLGGGGESVGNLPPQQIVNGKETGGPISYMIGVGKGINEFPRNLFCGGSLIAPRVVLSAAHCYRPPPGQIKLFHNMYNMTKEDEGVTTVFLEHTELGKDIFNHPLYDSRLKTNDVALLILPEDAALTGDGVEYATLNEDDEVPVAEEESLRVTGWGITKYDGNLTQLRMKCNEKWANFTGITFGTKTSRMCASDADAEGGVEDSCAGDSGGPLMLVNDPLVQVGVVSAGVGCALKSYPGLYARVSDVADWIKYTACKETGDFCPPPTTTPTTSPTQTLTRNPTLKPKAPAWNGYGWSRPTKRPVNAWNENKWHSWGGGWGRPKPTRKPTPAPVKVNAWDSSWSWGGQGPSYWVLNGWNGDAWGSNSWTGDGWGQMASEDPK